MLAEGMLIRDIMSKTGISKVPPIHPKGGGAESVLLFLMSVVFIRIYHSCSASFVARSFDPSIVAFLIGVELVQ